METQQIPQKHPNPNLEGKLPLKKKEDNKLAVYSSSNETKTLKHGLTLHASHTIFKKLKPTQAPVLPTHEAMTRKVSQVVLQPVRSQSLPRGISNFTEGRSRAINHKENLKKNVESPYKEIFKVPQTLPITSLRKNSNPASRKISEPYENPHTSRRGSNVSPVEDPGKKTQALTRKTSLDSIAKKTFYKKVTKNPQSQTQSQSQSPVKQALPSLIKQDQGNINSKSVEGPLINPKESSNNTKEPLIQMKTKEIPNLQNRRLTERIERGNPHFEVGKQPKEVGDRKLRFSEAIPAFSQTESSAMPRMNGLHLLKLLPLQKEIAEGNTPRSQGKSEFDSLNQSVDQELEPSRRPSSCDGGLSRFSQAKNEKNYMARTLPGKMRMRKRVFTEKETPYFNPLYKDGYLLSDLMPELTRRRPKISKKFKNSVMIKYPDVYVEVDEYQGLELSVGDTSVDTDTFKYYTTLHNEFTAKMQVKRKQKYEELMKMDIVKEFANIDADVRRLKVIKLFEIALCANCMIFL